jgi:hypothetical protein
MTYASASTEVNENELNKGVARPGGFEPSTLCFGGTRSIHLSYGRNRRLIRRGVIVLRSVGEWQWSGVGNWRKFEGTTDERR